MNTANTWKGCGDIVEINVPISMKQMIDMVKRHFKQDHKIQAMFEQCFSNTYQTTIRPQVDGTTFVITGDIPAMWLRDSAAQVRPYLLLAETDHEIADMIQGVLQKQFMFITHDPYANAFNETANGNRYHDDQTSMTPLLWERKYEVDSLCYPLQLAYLFWKSTGRLSHFNAQFLAAVRRIIDTWRTEQDHEADSTYYFARDNCPKQDTLSNNGKGSPVAYTGMTWSGFRPSDDACQYGYLIPANMFAVVVLKQLAEIADEVLDDRFLKEEAVRLANEIDRGIEQFAKVQHPTYGTIYAYETDGLGNYNLMDDANVPSLLSIPYFGYCDINDPIYLNTRRFILSKDNPYYYQGKAAKGIGSPHTPEHYIWHIALAIQGMTAVTEQEKEEILNAFKVTDGNTGLMHEGFHVDNPADYTRPWFSWANSMFSEFVLNRVGYFVKGSPFNK
ncbi:glycoside hydrolase family 125 protein [Virgibacillus sp. M23]|uniref:glycoside hydrolase family 125 protein n=1 Tax=Virgibacillus sp. M23 TaxID=3079030 RepID=UPI002A9208AF|nr:glycoside hydrolase family 125 protein [Virgibacillus sp. M23]MDY7045877.1 glycoside hydrolase family 125 protein [Virgibacillus sp. M23]